MEFKELNIEEINLLTGDEKLAYFDKYNLHKLYLWSEKSFEEKQKELFANYEFYIGRRGIEGITLEEIIEIAVKNNPNQNSKYISPIIELYSNKILSDEHFTYFWETKSPFSQWYKSDFTATNCLIVGLGSGREFEIKKKGLFGEYLQSDSQTYSSAEQFMMFHKAIIFLDLETAKSIMQTNDVRKIKELGKQVKNFDETIWKFYRSKVVYEGNKSKFTQNEELKEVLISTKNTTLVEAAYNDSIWGIGLSKEDQKSKQRTTWEGKNLLGEILTILREELIDQKRYNNA